MWHWLAKLLHHGGKHTHHAAKHIPPTIKQVQTAASIIGGINAGMSIYERLKKKDIPTDSQGNSPVENDETLYNDFVAHIESIDKTMQELKTELQVLKEKNSSLSSELEIQKKANIDLTNISKANANEILANREVTDKNFKKIEILQSENKLATINLNKAFRTFRALTIVNTIAILGLAVLAILIYTMLN